MLADARSSSCACITSDGLSANRSFSKDPGDEDYRLAPFEARALRSEVAILRGMPEAHRNATLIREFHDAQNRFYAGGDQEHVRAMLAEDVAWHVPGRSAIAGDYRGRDEVLRYFVARRELARETFRIVVRGVLADDERAVIFAGGRVQRDGESSAWETVGVFRIANDKIAECWVLPYDQYSFDEIWSPAPGSR